MKAGEMKPGDMSGYEADCPSSGLECMLHLKDFKQGCITGAALGRKSKSARENRLFLVLELHCENCNYTREFCHLTDIPFLDVHPMPDLKRLLRICARMKLISQWR